MVSQEHWKARCIAGGLIIIALGASLGCKPASLRRPTDAVPATRSATASPESPATAAELQGRAVQPPSGSESVSITEGGSPMPTPVPSGPAVSCPIRATDQNTNAAMRAEASMSPTLGSVPGQRYLGRVIIYSTGGFSFAPASFGGSSTSLSTSLPPDTLSRAAAALKQLGSVPAAGPPWNEVPTVNGVPQFRAGAMLIVELWTNAAQVAVATYPGFSGSASQLVASASQWLENTPPYQGVQTPQPGVQIPNCS